MVLKQKYARNLFPKFLSSVTGNEVGIFSVITVLTFYVELIMRANTRVQGGGGWKLAVVKGQLNTNLDIFSSSILKKGNV